MKLAEPDWWHDGGVSLPGRVLEPLGWLYGAAARLRFRTTRPYRAALPVVCVGNFTVGGTGKTPLCQTIRERLVAAGRVPVILSRGYGGTVSGPHLVDPRRDTGGDVGDEPLLLARDGPVMIARDRAAGAAAIHRRFGASAVILMDDGLQNPSLAKDLSLAVVDGGRRLGNGRVFPAGPLRAPLAFQARLVDAVVVNTPGAGGDEAWIDSFARRIAKPVLAVRTEPAGDLGFLSGARVVAFAGIGNPERFFRLAEQLGADLVAKRAFSDHHPLDEGEARSLLATADAADALLLTTEKDCARLAGRTGAGADLAARVRVLPIRLRLGDDASRQLDELLGTALNRRVAEACGDVQGRH